MIKLYKTAIFIIFFFGLHYYFQITSAYSAIYYVSKTGNHISPFSTPVNAATNIQPAVDIATNNSTIIILDNGNYSNFKVISRTNFFICAVSNQPGITYGSHNNRVLFRDCRNIKMSNIFLSKASGDGLKLTNTISCTLMKIVSKTNSNNGIILNNCADILISSSTSSYNSYSGFRIFNCTNIHIQTSMGDNNNEFGIQAGDGSKDIKVYHNICKKNNWTGIWVGIKNGTIKRNISCSNSDHGISCYKATNILISSNITYGNYKGGAFWLGHGIYLQESSFCKVIRNHSYLNDLCGIRTCLAPGNRFEFNIADKNFEAGIMIDNNSTANYLLNNTLYSNNWSGIQFSVNSTSCTAVNNICTHNGVKGINLDNNCTNNYLADYNCYFTNSSGTSPMPGENVLTSDPDYISLNISDNKYLHLNTNSDCVDTAYDDGVTDYNPLVPARYSGNGPDRGAVESPYTNFGPYYVDNENGDDNNHGLNWATSFKTIQKGINMFREGIGNMVYVMANLTPYTNSGLQIAKITNSGTDLLNIYNISGYPADRDRALIDGRGLNSYGFLIDGARFIRVRGFEFINTTDIGCYINSSHSVIVTNCLSFSNNNWGFRVLFSCTNISLLNNESAYNKTFDGIEINNNCQSLNFQRNNCHHNKREGIRLNNSCNITSSYNISAWNNENGIYITGGENIYIYSNSCLTNRDGIYIDLTENVFITNNTVISSTNSGINCRNSTNVRIVNNIISRCQSANANYAGIYIYNNNNNIIVNNNNCNFNNNSGILLTDQNDINLINNHCENNNFQGIKLSQCMNCSVITNTLINNNDCGLYLETKSSNIFVINNIIANNNNSGIIIRSSSFSSVTNNAIYSNNCFGIRILYSSTNITIADNDIRGTFLYDGINIEENNYNTVIKTNQIYKNSRYGISFYNTVSSIDKGRVINNNVFSNYYGNIYNHNSDNNIYQNNRCHSAFSNGFIFNSSKYCLLSKNYIFNNKVNGLILTNNCSFIIARSNNVFNNYKDGFYLNNVSNATLIRNFFYYNNSGIIIDNSDDLLIRNNVVFSNCRNGVVFQNSSSDNIFRNNIVVYNNIPDNGDYYGLVKDAGSTVSNTYNNIYGNKTSLTNSATGDSFGNYQGILPGVGAFSPSRDPYFLSMNNASSNFLHLSNISACIEAGSPEDDSDPVKKGLNLDIGAFEFFITNTIFYINKWIDEVMINSSVSDVIPGSSLIYSVAVSNIGPGEGIKMIIYDKLCEYITYKSNLYIDASSGWVIEWSTNVNPLLGYYSDDFTMIEPSADKIKWVRWINPVVNIGEKSIFSYKVIIN